MAQRGKHADLEPLGKVEWTQNFDFVIIGPNSDFVSSPPAVIDMVKAVNREDCTFLTICWGYRQYDRGEQRMMTSAVPEHKLVFPEHRDFRERLDMGHGTSAHTVMLAHDLLKSGTLRLVDTG